MTRDARLRLQRSCFYLLYTRLLFPLLRAAFRGLAVFHPKIRAGLRLRAKDSSGVKPWLNWIPGQRPIWMHCASGEFEYAKPVIKRLKEQAPRTKILVTYFSPSIAAAAERFPGVDFACPVPWDCAPDLREFISHHQPRLLLIARTDAWPEMLRQTHLAGIGSLLFAATLTRDSGRARGWGRWVSKATYSYVSQIFCVSDEDRALFAELGCANSTVVAGDTRFDQVKARLRAPKPLREELFALPHLPHLPHLNEGSPRGSQNKPLQKKPLLVAGSTWAEDEDVLLGVIKNFQTALRFVVVPHEPTAEHLRTLEAKIASHGLRSIRYTNAPQWNESEILLVDTVGILAELYSKGEFAFVGGSFKTSVHSVMEPLAAGCLTFVGPFHKNNREALEFRRLSLIEPAASPPQAAEPSLTLVQPVTGQQDFIVKLGRALQQTGEQAKVGQKKTIGPEGPLQSTVPKVSRPSSHENRLPHKARIQSEVELRSGKSDLVVNWILARIKASDPQILV